MPKVTKEYTEEKKNLIMNVTMDLIKNVPLYQITMRDIINQLQCSQGMIYRYYKNVDEIYVNLMNREIKDIDVTTQFDQCLNNEDDNDTKLYNAIHILGTYILKVQQKIGGKFYYEIAVSYAFDAAKQKELLPKLIFKQNLLYIQNELIKFIEEKIEQEVFSLDIPLDIFASYVGNTIDGISNHSALMSKW